MTRIYYILYLFSLYMSKTISSSIFVKPKFDAVFLLSSLELLNISSVWIYFSMPSLTSNTDLDVLLCSVLLLLANGLFFFKKERHDKISTRYENDNGAKSTAKFITVVYSLLSVIIFYLIHSSKT